ncbi:CsbD family protein [Limnobacter sp.]|uniref:CsbD family protein n=1 Tax=Limnobacter sp. TaxID=2003368 RepID=UPI0035176D3F
MPNKYEGKYNMAMGVTKQKIGELTGNKALAREGQFQKIKGATQDATQTAKNKVEQMRRSVNASTQAGLDTLKKKIKF